MTPTPIAGVSLRHDDTGDYEFILNSWLQSYRDGATGSQLARRMSADRYFSDEGFKGGIIRALTSGTVTVACDTDDPETIYGWACHDGDVLHYVYVRSAWRRKGLGRTLAETPKWASCWTEAFTRLGVPARFNPYLMV